MISLKNKVVLAPMAGVTDRAFREICMQNGADMCFTEMVSTKGLFYNDKKTAGLLEVTDAEQPVYAQIFGHEPEIFAAVAKKAASFVAIGIDINCGCPAGKIISNNDGGCLMKTPQLIYDIVCAVRENCDLPVSVKIRKGWDESFVNAVDVAKMAEKAGVSHIAVHGRTVRQGYTGESDNDIIKQVVSAVSVPVIGNGDVKTVEDAVEMFEKTKCDAIMIGRGALGNPWLFRQINHFLETGEKLDEPTVFDKLDMCLRHAKELCAIMEEKTAIKEMRTHACYYIKGMPNSCLLKNDINRLEDLNSFENLIYNYKKELEEIVCNN
jgi:tRNA-dihydrouridine synthase B